MGVRQPPNCVARTQNGECYQFGMPKQARKSDLKPELSRRLKAARSVVFGSSDACAKELDVHRNTWRNYEEGARYPDPWLLVKFCDLTGFTMDFMYRGRLRGIEEDVLIRVVADHPTLVDEAPDMIQRAEGRVNA